jgi:hypothetical protein
MINTETESNQENIEDYEDIEVKFIKKKGLKKYHKISEKFREEIKKAIEDDEELKKM